jgi:hypothetical protein
MHYFYATRRPCHRRHTFPTAVQLSEIIGAMSYALDLAEGRDCFVALTRALALMPEPAASA